MKILLSMAHTSLSELNFQKRQGERGGRSQETQKNYYALDGQYAWQGPFTLSELATIPWFSPFTWVSDGGETVTKASQIPSCTTIFTAQMEQVGGIKTDYLCPVCQQNLLKQPYEKTRIYQCKWCGGTLVDSDKLPRIILRRGNTWAEKIKARARETLKENQLKNYILRSTEGEKNKRTPLRCPKCKGSMWRTFYSYAYLIEIDRCICGALWFDQDELSMLQCMIENKMAGENLYNEEGRVKSNDWR